MDSSDKINGSLNDQLTQLMFELDRAVPLGNATPEAYKLQMTQLLKAVHGISVKARAEIQRMEQQISHNEATQKACGMFSSMLLNIVTAHNRQALRAFEEEKAQLEKLREQLAAEEDPDERAAIRKDILKLQGDVTIGMGSSAEQDLLRGVTSDAFRESVVPAPTPSVPDESALPPVPASPVPKKRPKKK